MNDLNEQVSILVSQGRRADAQRLLAGILQQDRNNIRAWVMMSELADNPAQEIDCLNRVLELIGDSPLRERIVVRLAELEALVLPMEHFGQPSDAALEDATPVTALKNNSHAETILLAILGVVLVVVMIACLVTVGYRWLHKANPQLASMLPFQSTYTPTSSAANIPTATLPSTDTPTPVITLTPTITSTPTMTPIPPELPVVLPKYLPARSMIAYARADSPIPSESSYDFGTDVAVSGDMMAISAPGEGTVHMYTRTRDSNGAPEPWVREAILEPPEAPELGNTVFLGASDSCLALEGDLLAICTYARDDEHNNRGAVDVYRRTDKGWTWESKLRSPSDVTGEQFGAQVQIHEGLLYIGAPATPTFHSSYAGAVYIMESDGERWNIREKLSPPAGDISSFGWNIACDGNTLVVSAQQYEDKESNPDSTEQEPQPYIVYVYQQENDQWLQRVILEEPNADSTRAFGASLAIEGSTLAIGARGEMDTLDPLNWRLVGSGAVWIFEDSSPNRNWHTYNSTDLDEPATDYRKGRNAFGVPVVLENGVLFVGAREQSAVFVYQKSENGDWEQKTMLQRSTPLASKFGVSIAVDGETVLVGASGTGGYYEGDFAAVYFFDVPLLSASRVQLGAQPGQIDPSFGKEGLVTIRMTGDLSTAKFLTLPDGTMLLGGVLGENNVALNLFQSDGTLDSTFGNGKMQGYHAIGDTVLRGIEVAPDGKIVMAVDGYGSSEYAGSEDDTEIALIRFNKDGSIDTEYGQEGLSYFGFWPRYNDVVDLAIQPDGGIVFASSFEHVDGSQIARFDPDGNLDKAFGRSGIIKPGFDDKDHFFATDLLAQSDGRILALGQRITSLPGELVYKGSILWRFNADGTPDHTFSEDGMAEIPDMLSGNSLLLLPDSSFIIGGAWDKEQMALVHMTPEGQFDSSFGTEGVVVPGLPLSSELETLTLRPNGKILAMGSLGGNPAIFCFNADGSLDRDFNGGYWQGSFASNHGSDSFIGLGVLPDGNIMFAGYMKEDTAEVADIVFARILGN